MFSRYVWAALILLFSLPSSAAESFYDSCAAAYDACGGPWCTYLGGNGWTHSGNYFYCHGDQGCEGYDMVAGENGQCFEPETPPDCGMGTWDAVNQVCNIGDGGDCENVTGYIDGHAICADDQNDCAATGGTYGQVQGQAVCIPEGYGDNLPDCSSSGGMVMVDNGDGGGFVCESPTDNENGTDNESGGQTDNGQDPNTEVNPENPESPNTPDPDPSTITDSTQLQQEGLKEAQEASKELRKQTNQLGDVNKELDNITKNTDRTADELELQNTANDMPSHTVANTVEDVIGNFWIALQGAPIVQAAYGFGDVIPQGGTCSPLSVDLGSGIGQISSNMFCELLDEYGEPLSWIVLLCFAFASFRVFFSA